MTNTVVRARIDEHVKEVAATVLAAIGLTVSDAFRLMMMRIAKDKALPFEPLTPNANRPKPMERDGAGQGVPSLALIQHEQMRQHSFFATTGALKTTSTG